ncbi:hypothetical protein PRK78_002419 [Emydomyces testavorans]|uniref:Uncharacterized protein n=1 Tax=Emydomyces testavorans TaxID=2070801 RepID=A0AAF0DFP6_9EURO|nr:hypothetical protein PRK78_002419 [Emydomyces testavorans]
MLPQKYVKWLATQSETILSSVAVRIERNGIHYLPTTADPKSSVQFIDKVIGQALSRNLDVVHPDMYDEIRHVVDEVMGTDVSSWHEINLSETMSTIVDRASTRVLFGLTLCRNGLYLRILRFYIIFMGASTLLIGQLPPWFLRPLVGVLLMIPTAIFKKLMASYIQPSVEERIQNVGENLPDENCSPMACDFVTQSVQCVKKFRLSIMGDVSTYLTEQFLFLAFAAIATTGVAATNIFLDIFSANPHLHLYETLRLEATSVFQSENDWTSPASMKKMTITDSAIRESLRMNTLQSRGLLKQVMPKAGISLPDGTHVPQGTWLGVPVQAVHMDDNHYLAPREYDPLRFARLKEAEGMESKDDLSVRTSLDCAQPSDNPGRFFAARLLKLLIAYIIMHYDVKPLARRLQNYSLGDASIPSFTTKIRVRRRNNVEH